MAPAASSSSSTSAITITSLDDIVQASISARSQPPGSDGHRLIASAVASAIYKLRKPTTMRGYNEALRERLSNNADPLQVLLAHNEGLYRGVVSDSLARLEVDGDRTVFRAPLQSFAWSLDAFEAQFMPETVSSLADWIPHIFGEVRSSRPSATLTNTFLKEKSQNLASIELCSSLLAKYRAVEPAHTHTLTTWHQHIVRIALRLRLYNAVLDLLLHPIDNVDLAYSAVTCKQHLLYHYYGGCILAAAGYYAKAISFFETVVTVPGTAASAISLDAYKKYILVSLLSTGKVAQLPKYTSTVVTSAFKNQCGPYLDLQNAFQAFDRSKVREIVKRHQETFVNDGNYGLLLRCMRRLKLQAILRLRRTYITVSMQEVAVAMEEDPLSVTPENLAAAENAVLSLMRNKEIHADIAHAADGTATVTFLDDPEPFNTEQTVQTLLRKLEAAEVLGAHTRLHDDVLARHRDFLTKALKQNFSTGGPSIDEAAGFLEEDEEAFS